MAAKPKKTAPGWSDVKNRLAELDRAGLLGLVQDLYAAGKGNQTFLHTRFGLGDDVLEPYITTIDRWISPDVYRNQNFSVSKAKKAISDYKKASGRPEDLAELMVFFCERGASFCREFGVDDETFMVALVRMFEQALKQVAILPEEQRHAFIDRLDRVSVVSGVFGSGVADVMKKILAKHR